MESRAVGVGSGALKNNSTGNPYSWASNFSYSEHFGALYPRRLLFFPASLALSGCVLWVPGSVLELGFNSRRGLGKWGRVNCSYTPPAQLQCFESKSGSHLLEG